MKSTLIIAFSFVTFSVFAQNNTFVPPPPPPPGETNIPDTWGARYFHFGLNFTPGIYWVVPNSSTNSANGAKLGYSYGANLEFYFTPNYGIVLGLEIANIGTKYTNNIATTGYYYDSTIHHNEALQYLELPLLLKMKTSPIGRMRYYGLIGLNLGFCLKATDNYTYSLETNALPPYPGSYSANNIDIYNHTDFFRVCFVIGGGAEYQLAGSTALQASVTYNNCFTNMNRSGNDAANIKGVELMLGILF
jgi:opacity protein-like surface antigen